LEKCGDVEDELELLNAPLKYQNAAGLDVLLSILRSCQEESLPRLFAVCAKTSIDLVSNAKSSVGVMLMEQVLIKLEAEDGINIVLQSVPVIVNHFFTKSSAPTQAQLLALVRVYSQSVKIPATYLRFWTFFFLHLRPDILDKEQKNIPILHQASPKVVRLATCYFPTVFVQAKTLKANVKTLFQGRAPLRTVLCFALHLVLEDGI